MHWHVYVFLLLRSTVHVVMYTNKFASHLWVYSLKTVQIEIAASHNCEFLEFATFFAFAVGSTEKNAIPLLMSLRNSDYLG